MNHFLRRSKAASLAVLSALILGATGCGKAGVGFDSEMVIGASCQVATDQRQSFMAKVPGFPLTLMVDSEFSPSQAAAIEQAARTWNALGNRLIGSDFFAVQNFQISSTIRSMDPRDCSRSYGSANALLVQRETDLDHWKSLGFSANNPGATQRCFAGSEVRRQTVIIYTNIIDEAQFASVLMHELGHVLGLDHSCSQEGGNDRYKACSQLPENHPYRSAVMYPSIRMNSSAMYSSPEIKETLRTNDILRTECLYGG